MNTRRYSKFIAGLGISLILLSMVGTSARAAGGDTTRVSVAYDAMQWNSSSAVMAVSANKC